MEQFFDRNAVKISAAGAAALEPISWKTEAGRTAAVLGNSNHAPINQQTKQCRTFRGVVYVASAARLGSGCSPPKEEDLFYGFGKQTRRGLIIWRHTPDIHIENGGGDTAPGMGQTVFRLRGAHTLCARWSLSIRKYLLVSHIRCAWTSTCEMRLMEKSSRRFKRWNYFYNGIGFN